MIVNKPAIDYIRLTTFNQQEHDRVSFQLIEHAKLAGYDKTRHGWQQYKGDLWGNIFMGQGEQNGKTHFIIDVSGSDASDVYGILRDARMSVKRVDLQYTVPLPKSYNAYELLRCFETGLWIGRRPKPKAILNGGDDTVYLGARASEVFARIYVKHKEWLRWEYEYSGDVAPAIWERLNEHDDIHLPIAQLLLERTRKAPCSVPAITLGLMKWEKGKRAQPLEVYRVQPEKINKLRWLNSLIPAITALASDHDYGHTVRGWLVDILNEVAE